MLFLPREEGQGLVEYALILVLVAIVVIAILLLLGPDIGNVFSLVVNSLSHHLFVGMIIFSSEAPPIGGASPLTPEFI